MNKQTNDLTIVNTETGKIQLSIDIVKNQLVAGDNKGISDKDVMAFIMLCSARKLNPYIGEAHLIKYGSDAQIVTGKDVFLKRLNKNPKCEGMEVGVIVLNNDNEIVERKGSFYLPNEKLVGAYTIIKRKDWKNSFKWTIRLNDYIRTTKAGEIQSNWKKMPAVMLTKCCYVATIRLVFPEDFGGMYDEAELNIESNEFNQNVINGDYKIIDNNSSNTTKTNNNVYDNGNDEKMTQSDKETLYKLKKILFIVGKENEDETLKILKEVSAFKGKDGNDVSGVDSFSSLTPGRIKATYGQIKKKYKNVYEQVKKELEEKKKKFEESKKEKNQLKENTKNDNKEDNNKKDEDNQELTDIVKPTEDKEESKK